MAARKTEKGYRLETRIVFYRGEVEESGWAADREIRVGVLVQDADDPEGRDRKTIGVWRTAADARDNCASLTTFVTEK